MFDQKEYDKNYYLKNRDKKLIQVSNNQKKNIIKIEEQHRDYHHKRRILAFNLLGNECVNPYGQHKEPYTDIRCLQIDHINGGGRKHLKKRNSYGIISDVIKDPDRKLKYQLMCANCNWIKRFENKENG